MCSYFKHKYDYILIWGHGIQYRDEILKMLRLHPDFEILRIMDHSPKKIKDLVKVIYSYDYAPLEHLRYKTRYLMKTPGSVIFIFFLNKNPDVDFRGNGSFRHEESMTLKKFKEELRDKFNPRINGKRTEDHVIHASDNEAQTDYILKHLGFRKGVNLFQPATKIIDIPYYLNLKSSIAIKKVKIDDLYCRVVYGAKENFKLEIKKITDSPQFKGLTDISIYRDYINKFLGGALSKDYNVENFRKLADNFSYLESPFELNYIIAAKQHNRLIILDGLHRASILKYMNYEDAKIAILS